MKIKQRDITDCGAACLASVAGHYKLKLPVAQIRQIAGTDQRGTNVLGMVVAAEQLGFNAKGVKGAVESLPKIRKFPFINGFGFCCSRMEAYFYNRFSERLFIRYWVYQHLFTFKK